MQPSIADTVQRQAYAALMTADPGDKGARVRLALERMQAGTLSCEHPDSAKTIEAPGRPQRPRLVAPGRLEKRGLGSDRGRACLVHAVAHIEFNAVNLALDAVYRFPAMPRRFYQDWLGVAADEVRHFEMLCGRLAELGFAYGDFPAHNGLWEMAVDTGHCATIRMALVPRVLEARGLDVSPGMIERLQRAGDRDTARILQRILAEEVEHVAIGTRWYRHLCARQGLDPRRHFMELLERHFKGRIRGPFNHEARIAAGFERAELQLLEQLSSDAG